MTVQQQAAVPAGYEVLDLPATPALGLSYLRAVSGALRGGPGASAGLPPLVLRRSGIRPDPRHVARYAELVGAAGVCAPAGGGLPLLYPNVLGFPLQLALMTGPRFPFPVVGLVHLENAVRRYRDLAVGTPLDIEVRAERLRPHRLGQVLDVVTVVRQGGHVGWTQVGTFLRRGRGGTATGADGAATADGSPGGAAGAVPVGPVDGAEPTGSAGLTRSAVWTLDAGLGRACAAVTGDRNPIHLYPVTARPFGFSRPIAHGMWLAARLWHALEAGTPTAGVPVGVECVATFRKPVPLPSTVDVFTGVADQGPDGGAGPRRAQLRRHDSAAVCCDLLVRPTS